MCRGLWVKGEKRESWRSQGSMLQWKLAQVPLQTSPLPLSLPPCEEEPGRCPHYPCQHESLFMMSSRT